MSGGRSQPRLSLVVQSESQHPAGQTVPLFAPRSQRAPPRRRSNQVESSIEVQQKEADAISDLPLGTRRRPATP